MRRIREEFRTHNASIIKSAGERKAWQVVADSGIAGIFLICDTKEGYPYWIPRAKQLGAF